MEREITEARIFHRTALANLRRTVPGSPIRLSAIRRILLRLGNNLHSHTAFQGTAIRHAPELIFIALL
jgi:hypothetical protein